MRLSVKNIVSAVVVGTLFSGLSVQASVTVPFNVYWSGDSGGETLANKSWVPGMANIGSGSTVIGHGITVTLQHQDFDTGSDKNYGVSPDNSHAVYGLGAIAAFPDNSNPWNISITGNGIESVTLYFGDLHEMSATPVVFLPGVPNEYEGWSGHVAGTLTVDGTTLNIADHPTFDPAVGNGVHVFGGSVVVSVPEPSAYLLGVAGLALLAFRRKRKIAS